MLAGGIDDDRHAGSMANLAEFLQADHVALRGMMRHDEHARGRIIANRSSQLARLAALRAADQDSLRARQPDHLAHQCAEISVVPTLHDHTMLHSAGIGQLRDARAIRAGHCRRDADGYAGCGTRGNTARLALEGSRDPVVGDRLKLRNLDRKRKDRKRRSCGVRMRRAAAEHADWAGSVNDLAQRQRIEDIGHRRDSSTRDSTSGIMVTKLRAEDYPEVRENWAEAVFEGRAKCIVTIKSGHTLISDEAPGFAGGAGGTNAGPTPSGLLVASFAADIPVMLQRIANEIDLDIKAMRAKVSIEYSPRGIAGIPGYHPNISKAVSDIWIVTGGAETLLEDLKAQYLRRCPLYALFKNSGCAMVDNWHVERTR